MLRAISLPYGTRSVSLNFSFGARLLNPPISTLSGYAPAHAEEFDDEFGGGNASVADRPSAEPATREEAFPAGLRTDLLGLDLSRPIVVVADKTRTCDYPEALPLLVEALEDAGAARSDIVFAVAYGTHAIQSDAENRACYGVVYDEFPFIHHRADDPSIFTDFGRTKRGTPIRFRADLLKRSAVVTIGAVSHHYFAGFGGGRKLIFPGLGERAAIHFNHGLFLDRASGRLHRACRCGNLEGNPVAEDLDEVRAAFPLPVYAVHGVPDDRFRICRWFAGPDVGSASPAFRAACRALSSFFEVADPTSYDLVVASCGGHPKDLNFIQAHKGLHNAASFVRDGGTLVLYARCVDGIGSAAFLGHFEGGRRAAFDRLAAEYGANGGTALATMEEAERIRILLVTDLPEAEVKRMGMEKIEASEVQGLVDDKRESVAVIPKAGLLVKR